MGCECSCPTESLACKCGGDGRDLVPFTRVQVTDVRPGDVVVFHLSQPLAEPQYKNMKAAAEAVLEGFGAKVAIVESCDAISVLREAPLRPKK